MTPDEQRTLDELEQVLANRQFATAADLVRTGALEALVGGAGGGTRQQRVVSTPPATAPTRAEQPTTGQLPARR